MHIKKWILSILFSFSILTLFSQNFKIEERSTETYSNYFKQMHSVEKSLISRKIDSKVEFANRTISPEKFSIITDKFQKNLPSSFFESSDGIPIIDTNEINASQDFIKWTYAKLNGDNKIDVYLQLIVYFQVKENVYFPKVERIKILEKEEIKDLNLDQMVKLFKKRKKIDQNTPPPPKF